MLRMEKQYEMVKDILEDQIKKIAKKGDITPAELDNLYKASAIVLDFETKEAMKQNQGGYSNTGSYDMRNHRNGQSNHYPWFMYYRDGAPNNGNSYEPMRMENSPINRMGMNSMDYSRNSYNNSYDGAYDGAYDGSYDGSYEGSYEGSYDGSYDASRDNSYRRGRDQRTGRYVSRDRGYSRAMDKQRMIGKLQDMMDDATSDQDKRTLQQCVDKLERR
jgi:hypothetical protein